MTTQQGDVLLFQTNDDGDIIAAENVIGMTVGFETMAYLCLFGGNEDDDGSADTNQQYWGNLNEDDETRRYRSRTQYLLQSIPATSSNLLKIQDAVLEDLNVFLQAGIANDITATVTIPSYNRVRIAITIDANGREDQFTFTENWKAAA